MIKVDLITGFLGSGKTTFLKKYARYLINNGKRIGILENDYGAVNVDMMLLQDIEGDNCDLEMVAGGCDFDCHKRRFKTKLIAMGMLGYDRVIIEPSGIFDVDEFFDVLYEEPLDKWYEIGNVISIVDAKLEENLSDDSEYLLASQTANAGIVILSRTQETNSEQISKAIIHLNKSMEKYSCKRRFTDEVLIKDWDELDNNDFEKILCSGYKTESHIKSLVSQENNYSSLYFMNLEISTDKLENIARKILNDAKCGNVFRVKGFTNDNGKWYEFNATKNNIKISPITNGQKIVIVIGENLNKDIIEKYFN